MRVWPKHWFSWEQKKNDLNDEIEAHLRIAVKERMERGESQDEAKAAAMREIGNSALVATLTLGLGSVIAMLAIVDSVLIRPVALPHSDQLVLVYAEGQRDGTRFSQYSLSFGQTEQMRKSVGAFASVASYNTLVKPTRALDGTRIGLTVATT